MSEVVPDLYALAFMPGQFRCEKCSFQWSIQTIDVAQGRIGTTEENRQTPDCPNDGTRMVCVTYREQLEAYADRLKEEFDCRDELVAALEAMMRLVSPGGHFLYLKEHGLPMTNGDLDLIGQACSGAEAASRRAKGAVPGPASGTPVDERATEE